nr:3-ketosteroid-delta-1-dehydrogenase [Janibacter cremeus]
MPTTRAEDTTVDLLVIGSGTGLLTATAADEQGLSTLIVEKSEYVGGSMALSGGAFWIPGNAVLAEQGSSDSTEQASTYLENLVGDASPRARWQAYLDQGRATVDLMRRATPLEFIWAKGYADYHSNLPGGSDQGRSVESSPFDLGVLGDERARLRPTSMSAPVPMPITSPDYRWMNLMAKAPAKALPKVVKRVAQGVGGLALGRHYAATGQALAAGLYAGVLDRGIPVWTKTALQRLVTDGDTVTGAVLVQDGREVTVTARRGVVLAAGGFDHDMVMRHRYQSESLQEEWPLGAESNTGDAIKAGVEVGADLAHLEEAWWFPSVAPLPGGDPGVMLAERSLPGSFIIDRHGRRFVNESTDYMTFGQEVLRREGAGDPVGTMWIIFDQEYRNSYVFATEVFPRMPIPQAWFDAGIAHQADTAAELAELIDVPVETFVATGRRFNEMAAAGRDADLDRGESAYDRYYGDPTRSPSPNLRPLDEGPLYAVQVVMSDLGTCGGLRADEHARVLREDGTVITGLYATGNTAANAFGDRYPGAGATIGQGLVFGDIAARHAAGGREG